MNQENNSYGAKIERGIIAQAVDGKYIVQSYDRMGLTTPPIEAIQQHQYSAGDRVYFFLTDDGDGKIIGLLDGTIGGASGGTASFETDNTLSLENGMLKVNTAKTVEKDNTLPVTSAAVHTTVGNIEILLQTI